MVYRVTRNASYSRSPPFQVGFCLCARDKKATRKDTLDCIVHVFCYSDLKLDLHHQISNLTLYYKLCITCMRYVTKTPFRVASLSLPRTQLYKEGTKSISQHWLHAEGNNYQVFRHNGNRELYVQTELWKSAKQHDICKGFMYFQAWTGKR